MHSSSPLQPEGLSMLIGLSVIRVLSPSHRVKEEIGRGVDIRYSVPLVRYSIVLPRPPLSLRLSLRGLPRHRLSRHGPQHRPGLPLPRRGPLRCRSGRSVGPLSRPRRSPHHPGSLARPRSAHSDRRILV